MQNALNKKFMSLAIKEARKNLKSVSGGPFGACIVKNGRLVSLARNTVISSDATAHAEINAIRLASRRLKSFDLTGCTIYSTTEPCPMCFSAIHWARINNLIYGASIADAKLAGFNELGISSLKMKKLGKAKLMISSGFMAEECRVLLRDWDRLENKVLY